jgi:hypothetical protein
LNREALNSSGKDVGSVQKLEPFLNEQAGVKNGAADSPRELVNVLESAGEVPAASLPALVPIGMVGRPRVLTPELTEKLYMLLSVGFSRRQAASYLGISHGTISNVARENPEFAAELRRAEELTALQSEMTIMAAARKNWKAAAWYLTFKAKNPPALSEEEKAEKHQARLAEERRSAEASRAWMDAMRAPSSAELNQDELRVNHKVTRKAGRGK